MSDTAPARKLRVCEGVHGAVAVSARHLTARDAAFYYHLRPEPALYVTYDGHREDLIIAGCLTREQLASSRFDAFHDDGAGGLWYVSSKAGPGKRGWIEVCCVSGSRVRLAGLPGLRELFPEGFSSMIPRPLLRLVVDNTRA